MKTILLSLTALLLLSITSCSKECVSCSQGGDYKKSICRKNYDSKDAYDAAIFETNQIFGMTCK